MATKRKASTKTPRKKPESLRLRNISPGLTVNDLPASIAWYRDILGFTLGETWEHEGKMAGATLKAGTAELYLNQDDWAKGRDRKKGEGIRLYFYTAQDINVIAAKIKVHGGTLASEPVDQSWGARTFTMVDPDGYKLTISSLT